MKNSLSKEIQNVSNFIYTIRDVQVMLDYDLARIYQVETKALNQAVKRNIERFPNSFRFQLTNDEFLNLRSQFVTSSLGHGGRRSLPYAFTEQGVAMLSAVLRSKAAVQVSIEIMRAFVQLRKFITINAALFQRLDNIELKQLEADQKFNEIFKALGKGDTLPKQGVFFDGQIFDAYSFVSDLIRSAKKSIIIIDNYIDDTVLTLLSKKGNIVKSYLLTKTISKQMRLDVEKFNEQYKPLQIQQFNKSHDRFIIIDNNEIYHFGASLKDLGKKWFAFSRIDKQSVTILEEIKHLI